jgi:hypothetical protein
MKRLMAEGQAIRRCGVLAALLLVAGCSAREPHNQLARTIKDVRSWAADACMVSDRWRQRSVPTHYALDALEDAEHGLREQANQIREQQEVDPHARGAASDTVGRLLVLCRQVRSAIEHGDGATAERACRDISGLRDTLMRLASEESAAR